MGMEQTSCKQKELKDNLNMDYQIIKYIRRQKHDFCNHLQVISGYIQLKKYDKAIKYISGLNKCMNTLSSIFRLENPTLSLLLYEYIQNAYKFGIEIDFEAEVEYLNNSLFIHGYDEKISLLNKLFDEVLLYALNKEANKIIYIDIFMEDNMVYIIFSNSYCNDDDEICGYPETTTQDVKNAIESSKEYGVRVYYRAEDDGLTIKIGLEYKCL